MSKNSSARTNYNATNKKKFSFSESFSHFVKTIKSKKFYLAAIAILILLTMLVSVYVIVGASIKMLAQQNATYTQETNLAYKSTTAVGYYATITGEVERKVPTTVKDGGLASGYPVYGYTLSGVIGSTDDKKALRNALIAEANSLAATGTANAGAGGGYTWIDKDGYLYKGTTASPENALDSAGVHRQLYKHTSSVGLYFGNVSDDEKGVVKQITMKPRGYSGYGVTGLYAPAGEVIKVTISESDMNTTGGLTFHIGQALYNGQANNIWTDKNQMQRIPVLLNTLTLNKNTTTYDSNTKTYTGYIGSFIGGPIYIRNNNSTFTTTISGAVTYPHFILGYTTKEEFDEEREKSSAPYFDLEVWSAGVLHSGPKIYANNYSYDDLYNAAVLWEKVSTVTTMSSSSVDGIVFLYDPFVAAGAAVAFPGRRSVNCPTSWMTSSLNYEGIIKSGSWGNFHEYHHNFQGYGVGNGGEVTNNAMTLVSYALFTKISSNRSIDSYGAAGLSGWNCYTSATWALDQTLRIKNNGASNGNQGLALYATLLHNFGPEAFIQSKIKQRTSSYGENYTGYMRAWQETTHNDMTYYFKYILNGITDEIVNQYKNTNYPLFVPVSCVYQTGRSYNYDNQKREIETMQPYVIPYGENFTLDLRKYTLGSGNIYQSGSIILPDEFDYTIKGTPTCEYGRIVKTNTSGVYTYIPDPNHLLSGDIKVTLSITPKADAFSNDENFKNRRIDDVELTLGFEQTHEKTKSMLKRTTYTYDANSCYTDAVTAFENNYAGYSTKAETNNVNRTQNCNTDIWYTNQEGDDVPLNSVVELKGKIYVGETAKYRIAIRGRWNVALYVSLDGGKTYEKAGAYIQPTSQANYNFPDTEGTYSDFHDKELEAGTWVYFKAIMITNQVGSRASFLGVGWGKFTPEQGTIDEDTGELVDYQPESVHVTYATAYRDSYEFPTDNFSSDYFYTRSYSYTYGSSYDTNITNFPNIKIIDGVGVPPTYPLENLIDGDINNLVSSPNIVTSSAPWEFTIDLGKEITANRFVLSGYLYNNSSNKNQTPKSITLWVGTSLDNLEEIASFDNGTVSGTTLQFNFDTKTFRYYKLQVRGTVEGRYASIRNINFSYSLTGKQSSLDSNSFKMMGIWESKQIFSSFGHSYVGQDKSSVEFNFTGTRFAILSPINLKTNFIVYIDGKKLDSIDFSNSNEYTVISYLSKELDNKEHIVKIVCNGDSNIDSIVLF